MVRTVAEKMGIKPHIHAHFVNAPAGLLDMIGAPTLDLVSDLDESFDYIHLFVKNQREMKNAFASLKSHLAERGSLWVSWPKGGQLGTDLNLHEIVRIGYERGLVESTCLSIDQTWSALKFTHPKRGKVYRNSHADLVIDLD